MMTGNLSLNEENRGAFNQAIESWNTASVTTMEYMFYESKVFNQVVHGWNKARVSMAGMFADASAFNQAVDSWNTGSVTNMCWMFYEARAFNHAVDSWNTASVTTMEFLPGAPCYLTRQSAVGIQALSPPCVDVLWRESFQSGCS